MADLSKLFTQLEVFSAKDAHKEVRDTAMAILESSEDAVALKKVLVANINLDNYSLALNAILDYSSLVSANEEFLKLELGYVYYKLQMSNDLLNLSRSVSVNDPFKHILAQFYYRNGQEVEALAVYRELLQSGGQDEEDISVNERAVISQLRSSKGIKMEPLSMGNGSYDETFNDALIDILDGKYSQAMGKLDTAKLAISQSDDLSSDEKKSEILPIEIQRAYVLSLMGSSEESELVLKSLQCENTALQLIISNNLMALNKSLGEFEPTLLYREMGFPNSISNFRDKLSYTQELSIKRNEQLLAKLSQKKVSPLGFKMKFKYSGLPEAISQVGEFPEMSLKSVGKAAIAKGSIGLSLLACQLAISRGNQLYASFILEKLIESKPDVLNSPGVSKTLYSLYESLDQKNKMSSLLQSIYQELLMGDYNVELETFVIFIALKLMSIDEKKGEALLEKYGKTDVINIQFAQEDITRMVDEVDIEALISTGVTPLLRDTTTTTKVSNKRKRKQTKRSHHPTSTGKLDLERWLPMKDRTYYKPKRGKRDTQG